MDGGGIAPAAALATSLPAAPPSLATDPARASPPPLPARSVSSAPCAAASPVWSRSPSSVSARTATAASCSPMPAPTQDHGPQAGLSQPYLLHFNKREAPVPIRYSLSCPLFTDWSSHSSSRGTGGRVPSDKDGHLQTCGPRVYGAIYCTGVSADSSGRAVFAATCCSTSAQSCSTAGVP